MDFTSDLSSIFFTDFAVSATYGAGTIKVIFDRDGTLLQMLGAPYETTTPQALCLTSDVSAAVKGMTLVISSVTWYIADIKPTEDGTTLLLLSRDSR